MVELLGRLHLVNDIFAGTPFALSDLQASDGAVAFALWLVIGADLVVAVAFLMWLQRVVRNNVSLGAEDLQFSPAWAVG